MKPGDRGECAVAAFDGEHADLAGWLFEQGEMHLILVAPQAEHGGVGVDQMLHRQLPGLARDDGARPGAVGVHLAAFLGNVFQRRHGLAYPRIFAAAASNATRAVGK